MQSIHTKITSTLEHKVYKINSDTNEVYQNHNIPEIDCSVHDEKTCFAICSHCTKCLCIECLEKPSEEITTARREKLREIKKKRLMKVYQLY